MRKAHSPSSEILSRESSQVGFSPWTSVEPNQDTVVHSTGAAHAATAFDCNPIQCGDHIDQFL